MFRIITLLVFSLALVAGCGRDDADQPEPAATTAAGEPVLFERIDADTIYLAANREPMPEALIERYWALAESSGEINRQTYDDLADNTDSPLLAAFLRELGGIDSRESFEALGLHSNGHWALHGVSVYPVLHWQLGDAEAFTATLERIEQNAETPLPRRDIGDQSVVWIDLEDFGLAIHHDQRYATFALVPDSPALLRRVANIDQPAAAYSAETLGEFSDERGFTDYGSGFVDFTRLAGHLLDSDDEISAAARSRMGLDDIAANPDCRDELHALAGHFPRLSTGYTRLDESRIDYTARLETDAGLGEQLVALTDTPVALDREAAGLASLGMALDIVAARDFARDLVAGWAENPPQCPLFANIRENAGDWQLALNRPIPPMVTNLRGFRLNVDDLSLDDEMQVADAAGTLALFVHNPQMMLSMAQMFSPELAELELTPGGEAQPLPEGVMPAWGEVPTFIALGEAAIGLAVGEDHADGLPQRLDAGEADPAVFSLGINFTRYMELMQRVAEHSEELTGEDAENEEVQSFFSALGEAYHSQHMRMELHPQGVHFNVDIALEDD